MYNLYIYIYTDHIHGGVKEWMLLRSGKTQKRKKYCWHAVFAILLFLQYKESTNFKWINRQYNIHKFHNFCSYFSFFLISFAFFRFRFFIYNAYSTLNILKFFFAFKCGGVALYFNIKIICQHFKRVIEIFPIQLLSVCYKFLTYPNYWRNRKKMKS